MATAATKTTTVQETLNQQVANWTVMFTKLHNYHWYVTGENFFDLHEKFEEMYNYAGEKLDELAERILALQGNPVATLKECLAISTIDEASGGETSKQMLKQLLKDFDQLVSELKAAIKVTEKEEDDSTADLYIQIIADLQKNTWMLRAYAGSK
ncbi:MAG: DNA starvation/stationary phase protection protein [Gorillibacterium sp.]|nr:DNA starvation/stationary phase protection protein [Gorillibacterium sp.]